MKLKSRSGKLVATTFVIITFVGLILMILLIIYRTEFATWALRKAIENLELEDAQFQVVTLEFDSFEIEIVQISALNWNIKNGKIVGNYDLKTLWKNRKINEFSCSGLDVIIDLKTPVQSAPNEIQTIDFTNIESIFKSISKEVLSRRIPLDHLDLDHSTLQVLKGSKSITFHLSANIETEAQSLKKASIELDTPDGNSQISFSNSSKNKIQLQMNARIDKPAHHLDQWYPNWANSLNLSTNDSIAIDTIEIDAAATGKLEDLSSISAHANFSVAGLRVVVEDNETTAEKVNFHFKNILKNHMQLLSLNVASESIDYKIDNYQINGKNTNLEIIAALEHPLEWIDISAQSAIEVFNEEIALHLLSNFIATTRFSNVSPVESLVFECLVTPSLIKIKNQRIAPSKVEISGNAHKANVLIKELRLNEAIVPYLTNTQLNITFVDNYSPSVATLHSTISPQAGWPFAPLLSTSDLKLETTIKKVSSDLIELTALVTNDSEQEKFNLTYADNLLLKGNSLLILNASARDDFTKWQAQLKVDLNDAELEAEAIKLLGLKASFETKADQSFQIPSGTSLNNETLPLFLDKLNGALTWEADSLSREIYELKWPAGEIAINEGILNLNLEGSQLKNPSPVTPRRINFELNAPLTSWPKTTAKVRLETQIDGSPLTITGNLKGNLSDSDTPWNIYAEWAPFELEYSDIVSRLIPKAAGLSVTGKINGKINGNVSPFVWDGSLTTHITEGSIDLPTSQIKADGIEGTLTLDSLHTFTSEPLSINHFDIEKIQIGNLQASNTQFAWSWLSSKSIHINTAQTSILGGSLNLASGSLQLSPFDLKSQIHVSKISLHELGEFLDLFTGRLEGTIEGIIPFTFRDNIFLPKSTKLQLPQGTQAKLHYTSDHLKKSLETDSDYVLKRLKLQPSTLITNALSDLTITEFQINLFSQETPAIPLTIHIAGHGLSGKTKVPLILDIPIKGSLEELYILLLRLNTKAL